MWTNGKDLDPYQLASAKDRGYPNAIDLVWYITADGRISDRHKPRVGLDDQDVNLVLTALRYLALSPHLPMVAGGATRSEVERTIERVSNELFGASEVGQGDGAED